MAWLLVCALAGNVLVYAPECRRVADYNATVGATLMGLDFTLVPDASTADLPDSGNLVYIGTPAGAYYRQHLRDVLPFRFHGDTVFAAGEMARHGRKAELVDEMLDPSAGSGQALHKRRQKALTADR